MSILKGLGTVAKGGLDIIGGVIDAGSKITGTTQLGAQESKFAADLLSVADQPAGQKAKRFGKALFDKAGAAYKSMEAPKPDPIKKAVDAELKKRGL